jgi:hypothetical protein
MQLIKYASVFLHSVLLLAYDEYIPPWRGSTICSAWRFLLARGGDGAGLGASGAEPKTIRIDHRPRPDHFLTARLG